MTPGCFFAHLGGCDGRLVKAHLIPAQRIRREWASGRLGRPRHETSVWDLIWDERVWVPMCGGPTGIGGHHGQFDGKQISLAYDDLPEGVKEFASEYGLEWSLERDYGRHVPSMVTLCKGKHPWKTEDDD